MKLNTDVKMTFNPKGPICSSYNPSFSACFFSQNNIFLSQQISRNSVSACFFSEANEAKDKVHEINSHIERGAHKLYCADC